MKDERPFFIKEAENDVLKKLAEEIFESLKIKSEIGVKTDILKEKIFEQIRIKIKELKEDYSRRKEEEPWIIGEYGKYGNLGIDLEKSVDKLVIDAKELFDEIHLFGRVKKFFMPGTGIGVIPKRDKDGNLVYTFYDTKWTFVKRQG